MPWPPRLPNLNPIEHVWDMMERRLSNMHHPPQTWAQLIQEVQVAWNKVPQADINHLFLSMPIIIIFFWELVNVISCKLYHFIFYVRLSHCQKIKIDKLFLVTIILLMSLSIFKLKIPLHQLRKFVSPKFVFW